MYDGLVDGEAPFRLRFTYIGSTTVLFNSLMYTMKNLQTIYIYVVEVKYVGYNHLDGLKN